jgi:putative aldouronate transport system substrate-binding protein
MKRTASKKLRAFSFAMSIILFVGILAGCQGGAPSSSASVPAGGSSSSQAQAQISSSQTPEVAEIDNLNLEGLPVAKEPITLTMVARRAPAQGPYAEIEVFEHLAKETNVNIEWNDIPQQEYREKKQLLFVSGDLPDVFFGSYALENSDLITYGGEMLLELDGLVEQYGTNVKKVFEEYPDTRRIATAPDGHMYSLPRIKMVGNARNKDQMFINKKWLDQLELPVPTTLDEFKAALIAFRDNDMNGNGDTTDEYPFISALGQQALPGPTNHLGSLYGGFGIVDTPGHVLTKDGNVFWTADDEKFKQGITYLHEFFSEGLMRPEMYTMKNPDVLAMTAAEYNTVGSIITWGITSIDRARREEYVTLGPLAGPDCTRMWQNYLGDNDGVNSTGFSITTSCETPEIAFRWADLFYDRMYAIQLDSGYIGTGLVLNEETGKYEQAAPPEGVDQTAFQTNLAPTYSFGGLVDTVYDDLVMRNESDELKVIDMNEYYLPYMTADTLPSMLYSVEENQKLEDLGHADLKAYIDQMQAKWLVEGGIEAEWDGYLQTLKDMKYDEVLQVLQAAYDRYMGK